MSMPASPKQAKQVPLLSEMIQSYGFKSNQYPPNKNDKLGNLSITEQGNSI